MTETDKSCDFYQSPIPVTLKTNIYFKSIIFFEILRSPEFSLTK